MVTCEAFRKTGPVMLTLMAMVLLISSALTSHAVVLSPLDIFPPDRFPGDPIRPFTGSSAGPNTVINFAVLPPSSVFNGILTNNYTPSLGSPGFNDTRITYLYQVANTSSSPLTLTSLTIPNTRPFPGSICFGVPSFCSHGPISQGSFTAGNFRLDMLNGGAVVNAQGNNLQGANSFGLAGRVVSGNELINAATSPLGSSNDLTWKFQSQSGGIAPGSTSPLLGFQTNDTPIIGSGIITGLFANGNPFSTAVYGIAVAPEPSTILLFGTGLVGLVMWRRKNASTL